MKLIDDLKDRRGYTHLNDEALDRAMWRNRYGGALNLSSDRILNELMKSYTTAEFSVSKRSQLWCFSNVILLRSS
jgi:hypothetical protein